MREQNLGARVLRMFKLAVRGFQDDEVLTRAGSLAFFTALAFAPLLVLLLYVSALLALDETLLLGEVVQVLGPEAGGAVSLVIENAASRADLGRIGALISIGVLIASSTGVFVELQNTLNRIWGVQPRPGAGWVIWLRRRAASLGMLASTALILLVSVVLSTVVHLVIPQGRLATELVSILVFGLAFTALFRLVPAAVVDLRDAAIGGFATAALFDAGRAAVSTYLATSGAGSSYGAAGSLVALLFWVYYSAVIVLFGAELTQAWARTFGSGIRPRSDEVDAMIDPDAAAGGRPDRDG